jgi:hypothetical protein
MYSSARVWGGDSRGYSLRITQRSAPQSVSNRSELKADALECPVNLSQQTEFLYRGFRRFLIDKSCF